MCWHGRTYNGINHEFRIIKRRKMDDPTVGKQQNAALEGSPSFSLSRNDRPPSLSLETISRPLKTTRSDSSLYIPATCQYPSLDGKWCMWYHHCPSPLLFVSCIDSRQKYQDYTYSLRCTQQTTRQTYLELQGGISPPSWLLHVCS